MYSDLLRYRYLDQGYKQMRAKLGMRRVRPWKWLAFTNPARRDGLVLHHWRRQADEGKDYPFAKFNKSIEVPTYTEAEYQHHLLSAGWSRSAQGSLLLLPVYQCCVYTYIEFGSRYWISAQFGSESNVMSSMHGTPLSSPLNPTRSFRRHYGHRPSHLSFFYESPPPQRL